MLESIFIVLGLLSIVSSYILFTGGVVGSHTSNPYWVLVALPGVILSLDIAFWGGSIPYAMYWPIIGVAVLGSLGAAIREIKYWNLGYLPRPNNRDYIAEIILIVTGFISARTVDELLPEIHRIEIISSILIPLLALRWAITRLRR
jgi:hypothetical protein